MIARVGKEDKDGDKRVVVPPIDVGLQPPVDRVEIQLDAQPLGRRNFVCGSAIQVGIVIAVHCIYRIQYQYTCVY